MKRERWEHWTLQDKFLPGSGAVPSASAGLPPSHPAAVVSLWDSGLCPPCCLFTTFINDLDKDTDSILIKFTDSMDWDRIANIRDVRTQVRNDL